MKVILSVVTFVSLQLFGYSQDITRSQYMGEAEITATHSILLKEGFHVPAGSTFRAYITEASTGPSGPVASVPDENQNFTIINTIKTAGIKDESQISSLHLEQLNQTISYMDGLGRALQDVFVKLSPGGKDILQPYQYDGFGRQSKSYLSFTDPGVPGSYRANAKQLQLNFYQQAPAGVEAIPLGQASYAETRFEASPLGRPLEQGAPGASWKIGLGNTVTTSYDVNLAGEVKLWMVTSNGAFSESAVTPGTLRKQVIKDENGKVTKQFTDDHGRLISSHVVHNQWNVLKTDYVYDDLGNLMYVIPPAVNLIAFTINDDLFNKYIYANIFDDRGRIVEKKVPGSGWESIIYNNRNQPVFTQDAKQRATGKWSFAKYDELGRPVISGTYASTNNRHALQNLADDVTAFEDIDNSSNTGYTNNNFPNQNIDVFNTSYYDEYSFAGNDFGQPEGEINSLVKGQATGSRTKVLGASTMLLGVIYYDEHGNVKELRSDNHVGGKDLVALEVNFNSQVLKTKRTHTGGTSSVVTVIENRYKYDHAGRVIATYSNINKKGEVNLSSVAYNDIGQAWQKKLHNNLQTVTFAYNSRGWLKSVFNPLFAMELKFDQAEIPQYNGNIAEQHWGTPGNLSKSYVYKYDQLSRLEEAVSNEGNHEKLTYDRGDNVLSLTRANLGTNRYTYSGNQLQKVEGFKPGTFTYDENGNTIVDGTRDITISYNDIGLPQSVTGAQSIEYTYDGSGRKLKMINGASVIDYVNGIHYKNGEIEFINTSEGRALRSGSSYVYQYSLSDHLGNTRLSFYQNPVTGQTEVLQRDDYFPYGQRIALQTSSPDNKYLYNGKELQDGLDLLDYGARFYDPVLARWGTVDPLAGTMPEHSPYNYAFNNPVRYTDPTGTSPDDAFGVPIPTDDYGLAKFDRYGRWLAPYERTSQGGEMSIYQGGHAPAPTSYAPFWNSINALASTLPSDGSVDVRFYGGLYTLSYIYGDPFGSDGKGVGFMRVTGETGANKGGGPLDWAIENKEKLMATAGALANAYAGVGEIAGGSALMAAPTGVSQVAGGYLIADGATRIAISAVNIYGIWSGNQSAENAPHNALGLASMAVTSNQKTQQLFQLGGDFGLSRQNLIKMASGGFTNVFSGGQAAWQVTRPYKDAYNNFGK